MHSGNGLTDIIFTGILHRKWPKSKACQDNCRLKKKKATQKKNETY